MDMLSWEEYKEHMTKNGSCKHCFVPVQNQSLESPCCRECFNTYKDHVYCITLTLDELKKKIKE